ncbi:proline dehydrogenase family protein [Nocardioides massiliensis]|uniref:proline dehydrogenase n=1 Tax=Nocardioides massiliensis TaxID=1325935 RepID=A0ABT9NMK5_9ACTN|nr:proline dehydrogenase family protein [Nocardioides massiliensis]MDP9821651.1 proline dehydrogenase [Nocardioides massiliensis]
MSLLREPILALSRSDRVRDALVRTPVTRGVVERYVPGETTADAVRVAGELAADGLHVTLDHLGEDTLDVAQSWATVDAYHELLTALADEGLAHRAEVSVKLTALGLALPDDGPQLALEQAQRICRAARRAGTTVTIDMESHAVTDATLMIVHELRRDFPETGAVLQSYLHRTVSDCRTLAHEDSRVRLCKGAYAEPDDVAHTDPEDIARAYVRCLKILMAGAGYPMVATHDPRLIEIASALAARHGRRPGTYEFQMLYGIRPDEQRRLAERGETVRVYVPYGAQWYGYLMRRLAERPSNLTLFARSLVSTR